jgi:hypothetical protein
VNFLKTIPHLKLLFPKNSQNPKVNISMHSKKKTDARISLLVFTFEIYYFKCCFIGRTVISYEMYKKPTEKKDKR